MLELTDNLAGIVPDPVRYWIAVDKELGAKDMFTIGVPDPIPKEILELYAKSVYEEELTGKVGYTPVKGEEVLKKAIVVTERNFNVNYTDEDVERIYPTVGASQALQFVFSLFKTGSEILTSMPCWGTVFNMMAHSGIKGVPAQLFGNGNFIEENAEKALSDRTQAVYVNFPTNPNGLVLDEKAVKDFTNWALSHKLQIISDAPYKYLIYDYDKTPYVSPLNVSDDAYNNTIEIGSFSKVIKPDIRLGFIRISPKVIEDPKAERLVYFFRNLSASTTRSTQIGISKILEKNPKLSFLRPLVEGYKEKSMLLRGYFEKLGCLLDDEPAGGYFLFPKTPDGMDGEDYVRKMASEKKIGFIPGSGFGGRFKGFEYLGKYFRVGFGGGKTVDQIKEVFDKLV